MQPHVNLGINFRRHFEPLGVSVKRSRVAVEKKLQLLLKEVKEGIIDKEYAKGRIEELSILARQLRDRERR